MKRIPASPDTFLNDLVAQLGHAYGAERSVKLIHDRILTDRALLSIHKDHLGDTPDKTLAEILGKTGVPHGYLDAILARLPDAEIVHFGFEREANGYIYKCYLEFSGDYRRSKLRNSYMEQLVHYAVKWAPGRSNTARISYYKSQPITSLEDVKRYLASVYSACPASTAYAVALELIALPEIRNRLDDLMLMLVTEEDNDRLSFDLNLYDADMALEDISPQLGGIADYFHADMIEWRIFMADNAAQQLGHLAGGLDGKGREFFTVYFGVEERRPV